MSRHQDGFGAVEGLLVLVIIGLLGFTGWYVWCSKNNTDASYYKPSLIHSNNANPTLLAEIKDSGSTNGNGWDLMINTDGSGSIKYAASANPYVRTPSDKTFPKKTFDAARLREALDSTDLTSFRDSCARSASFGSVETLLYKKTSTRGIDCYIGVTNPTSQLSIQLKAVYAKAGV